MCFVDLEKAFDRVLKKVVEWTTTKKEIPEMMMKVVMSLNKDATTKIKVRSSCLNEFLVKVDVHQGSVLSPFLFATVIYVVEEEVRKGLFPEILCAEDLILKSNSTEGV